MLFHVGDHGIGYIRLAASSNSEMELPQVFEPRRILHHLPSLRITALARAVVHDGNAWGHPVDRFRSLSAVMRRQVEIHLADSIFRTQQRQFFVPGQVAQISKAELAELHQYASRLRVFGLVVFPRLDSGAEW